MRRGAPLVACALSVATIAACGNGTTPATNSQATRSASPYRTDASGQVSCSARSLPWHYAGVVRFDTALAGVSAQLRAVAVRRSYDQWLAAPQLTLTADGRQWHTTLKPAPGSFRQHYRPLEIDGPAQVSGYLCLVRFADKRQPPAVLTTYSGGAHCCTTVRLYDLESKHVSQLELGNMDARIALAGGRAVMETRDDAFSYAFTDFADSGAPIRLYEPSGASGFRNVTREFPAELHADAKWLWGLAAKRASKLGFYAAWAADEEMLGNDAYVWRTMHRLEQAGKLNVPANLQEPGWPAGRGYITKLRHFLAAHRYRT